MRSRFARPSRLVRLGLGLVLLFCAASASADDTPRLKASLYPSATAALKVLLASHPQVVAFGEYHQTNGSAKVASSLHRFSDQLLGMLQEQASDLIVETWVTAGNCGKKETEVVKDVETTTQRPVTTENEIVTLIKRAKADGIRPHILQLSCAQYKELQPEGGGVDYEKLLALVTDLLRQKITTVVQERRAAGSAKIVAVYGGAVHNALFPKEELSRYSFGPAVREATAGRYLEVDLFVPEYLEGDENMKKEPWYALYRKRARPGKTVVIRRGDSSYIIVFARTAG